MPKEYADGVKRRQKLQSGVTGPFRIIDGNKHNAVVEICHEVGIVSRQRVVTAPRAKHPQSEHDLGGSWQDTSEDSSELGNHEKAVRDANPVNRTKKSDSSQSLYSERPPEIAPSSVETAVSQSKQ